MRRAYDRLRAAAERCGYSHTTDIGLTYKIEPDGVAVSGCRRTARYTRFVSWDTLEKSVIDPLIYAEEIVKRKLKNEDYTHDHEGC